MRATPNWNNQEIMKYAEMLAFIFAFAQIALAVGLFWAMEAHTV